LCETWFSKYMLLKIEILFIPLLANSYIFEISVYDHPRLVTHARDHWRTLDFANASLYAGVNSRAEIVPRPGLTPGTALHAVGSEIIGSLRYTKSTKRTRDEKLPLLSQYQGKTPACTFVSFDIVDFCPSIWNIYTGSAQSYHVIIPKKMKSSFRFLFDYTSEIVLFSKTMNCFQD
jgi:hypothetical protein